MGDQLERFIKENRSQFDRESDGQMLWNRIENELDQEGHRTRNFSMVWKVAAIIFLASTSVLLVDRFFGHMDSSDTPVYSEFKQAEAFYASLIDEKKAEIMSYSDADLAREFLAEIEELDYMYGSLKETFDKRLPNQKLADAMIENLQLRIQILNKQLSILQQLNEEQNESDSDIEI